MTLSLSSIGAAASHGTHTPVGKVEAWTVTILLTLLTVVSFVDRQVLALLVDDLKIDLGISDMQFGILIGPAFIFTYNILLFPLAFLIDKWNRKLLLLCGCVLWASMTALSAFAQSYEQLIIFRLGLAVGEAFLGPISVSLIGDLFSREKRSLPTAIFVAGGTVGTTSATFFSAMAYQWATSTHLVLPFVGVASPWRLTLLAVAFPAFVLGVLFIFLAKEPVRETVPPTSSGERGGSIAAVKAHVVSHGAIYLLMCLSTGLALMSSSAINIWGPAFLMRAYGIAQVEAGYLLGGISIVVSVSGLLSFPYLVQWRARNRTRSVAMAEVATWATVCAIPGFALAGLSNSLPYCLAGAGLALGCLACAVALPTQLIQIHTPSSMKARITAAALFIIFLISIGIGPILIPFVAQTFFAGSFALGRSLAVSGMLACLSALLFDLWLRRRLVALPDG